MTRLVDLSMPVHADMLTFPRVPPPSLLLYESWTDFAERIPRGMACRVFFSCGAVAIT